MKIFIYPFLLILILSLSPAASAQDDGCRRWVDSVYRSLTPSARIGQLIMIRANSVIDSAEIKRIDSWITRYNLGGLCFFKGGPVRQAILANHYQSLAGTPLLVSMDAEWGLGMRLDSSFSFARQMTLGAMQDDKLIVAYGEEIARQLKRLGVHVSFSPVADINSNPANPVINIRSFGEDKREVARKALLYMQGLQKGGVISVAKHFPGHGDTDTDSHHDLPLINHSRETMDSVDLYPFKALIKGGIDGIMVAHLHIPAIDTGSKLPSSLSSLVVDSLLRRRLGFGGIVFTDALDMKGVAGYADQAAIAYRALMAGNDVLLLPENIDTLVVKLTAAHLTGLLPDALLESKCRKVLTAKYKAGLASCKPVKIDSLQADLQPQQAFLLNKQLYEHALTVVVNNKGLIPLMNPDTMRIASVTVGYPVESAFERRLSSYAPVSHYYLPRDPDTAQVKGLMASLAPYNLLLIAVNNTHPSPQKRFGISEAASRLIDSLIIWKPSVLNLFSTPYSLDLFRQAKNAGAVLIAYQDNSQAYETAAQVIFGGLGASGKLPVKANGFSAGWGIDTPRSGRFTYAFPEEAGIDARRLAVVDSIVNEGLARKAYPGCQVVIARQGKVVFGKSYGFHDYMNDQPVRNSDIYDLASITKVAAATLAVMKLVEEGKMDITKPLSKYVHFLGRSNKKWITVKEVLAHQAGLQPWIPFYRNTLVDGMPDTMLYRRSFSAEFPVKVAENLYLRKDYTQIILDSIAASKLLPVKQYKYSDLGFILLQQAAEHLSGSKLNLYMDKNFYGPMALPTMGYLPRERFQPDCIIPTENDTVFRHQLILGDVHDPAAAMMGGVAGHAGLFSNAADLAALFQMLLNHGEYAGRRYLDSTTVSLFTAQQFPGNRRGLGFDKPQLNRAEDGPACPSASANSFGHTGFTGTYVWADPDEQLIIVFLSNRVNPDASQNKLVQLAIRTRIQQAVYDAVIKNKD